jgi:hypothetical protein
MHHTIQVATVTTPTQRITKARVIIGDTVVVSDRRGNVLLEMEPNIEPTLETVTAAGTRVEQPTWQVQDADQAWTIVNTGGCGCGGTQVENL